MGACFAGHRPLRGHGADGLQHGRLGTLIALLGQTDCSNVDVQSRDQLRRELEDRWRARVDATLERYRRATQAATKALSECNVIQITLIYAPGCVVGAPSVPLPVQARKALREETNALRQYKRTRDIFRELIFFGRTPPED